MRPLNEEELNQRIETFIGRKRVKFPELNESFDFWAALNRRISAVLHPLARRKMPSRSFSTK